MDINFEEGEFSYYGMSKRFYAACMAMQGMLANPNIVKPSPSRGNLDEEYIQFSKIAFEYADELLKQEEIN